MAGRDPLPVAVSLYDQAGRLREKTIVKDRHAIIITKNGVIPARIKRKGLIGMKMCHHNLNHQYFQYQRGDFEPNSGRMNIFSILRT